MHDPIPAAINGLSRVIVDSAYRVHTTLGPGLLESVYETCLVHELTKRKITHQRQVVLPLVYEGTQLETGLRIDLLVDDSIVVEIKAVDQIQPVHRAQLLTYLKLSGNRLGLLINFNVPLIKDGITRMVL